MVLLVAGAGALGLAVGVLVSRLAGAYPWGTGRPVRPVVQPPLVELATGILFALAAVTRGPSWDLPAFLSLVASGVLLAVIDLRHRLLPDRVVMPSVAAGALLLLLAAAADSGWPDLLRAVLGALVLFLVFLVLALISPSSLGMGDVKVAALLGLYLGWLGWGALALGAAAGFVVQALVALALLMSGRVGLRGELPFGPAMLGGAAIAIGWAQVLLG
jgi:leader peptidase (prepilin peptidase) / N-methyltransferase